ncbi:MAG: phosphatidylserine decarboxylase family protein [Nitrospirota bacterium]
MADRAVGIPIVREGLPFVAATGGSAALAGALGWTGPAAVLAGLAAFTAWFFRNPRRVAPLAAGSVVAPGDGRVIAIAEEFEPRYLKDQSIRVSIFLNVFDVHVNRIPCDGAVEEVAYQPGRFVAADRPEATLRNEQNALMIRTAQGAKVLCVQVAGLIARRIVCWASPGEQVRCGDRYGLIRFGSRMDLFLPLGAKLLVRVGERVKGGETLLAQFG